MMFHSIHLQAMLTILRRNLHNKIHPTSNGSVTNPASGFDWLFDCAPSFFVDGNNVQILNEPSEFYNMLKVINLIFNNNFSSFEKRTIIIDIR